MKAGGLCLFHNRLDMVLRGHELACFSDGLAEPFSVTGSLSGFDQHQGPCKPSGAAWIRHVEVSGMQSPVSRGWARQVPSASARRSPSTSARVCRAKILQAESSPGDVHWLACSTIAQAVHH